MSDDEVTHTFEADSAFVCMECSVMRWGHPNGDCPACGEKGVQKLVFGGGD